MKFCAGMGSLINTIEVMNHIDFVFSTRNMIRLPVTGRSDYFLSDKNLNVYYYVTAMMKVLRTSVYHSTTW